MLDSSVGAGYLSHVRCVLQGVGADCKHLTVQAIRVVLGAVDRTAACFVESSTNCKWGKENKSSSSTALSTAPALVQVVLLDELLDNGKTMQEPRSASGWAGALVKTRDRCQEMKQFFLSRLSATHTENDVGALQGEESCGLVLGPLEWERRIE